MKKFRFLIKAFLITVIVIFANSVKANNEEEKKTPDKNEELKSIKKIEMLKELKKIEIKLLEDYLGTLEFDEIKEQKVVIYNVEGKLLYEGYEFDQNCLINKCDFMFDSGNTSFYLKTN